MDPIHGRYSLQHQQPKQQQQQQQQQPMQPQVPPLLQQSLQIQSSSAGNIRGNRPLSISSISSAVSSGSSSSAQSSISSGIQSFSLTRNGSLNYGHLELRRRAYLESIESLNASSSSTKSSNTTNSNSTASSSSSGGSNSSKGSSNNDNPEQTANSIESAVKNLKLNHHHHHHHNQPNQHLLNHNQRFRQPRVGNGSSKLQPSPSSASSRSNTSSLFRDDGFEDDLNSITHRVVTEIIETERAYVDDLEQIVTGYLCYLRNVLKQKHRRRPSSFKTPTTILEDPSQQQQQTARSIISGNDQLDQQEPSDDSVSPSASPESANNAFMVSNAQTAVVDDDDYRSIAAFDDASTTNVTNDVDYYDVEETDTDIAAICTKDSLSTSNNYSENSVKNSSNFCDASGGSIITSSQQPQNATDSTQQQVISAKQIQSLFSNLEDIYKFNKDLMFRLEECYLNPSSVAECFVENAAGFEVYTYYCTGYPDVVSTLTELMANQSSAELLRERQSELNQSLPLGAYLLKPVQRILKYHILFQSLVKHTSDDDSVDEKDRQVISEAFSVMTNIACHINEMKKKHEHAIRVQEVQGLLTGWQGPDLTTLGELILEDDFKVFNRPKSTRRLFLFDNVLLITKQKRDGSLCYKGHIACTNLMLIENIEGQPLVFNTVPFDNPKALCAFQAKNLDKKRDWCIQMKEIIIRSFKVQIPSHVRDILISLTTTTSNSATSTTSKSTSETARLLRAPNYLEKKRDKQDKKK